MVLGSYEGSNSIEVFEILEMEPVLTLDGSIGPLHSMFKVNVTIMNVTSEFAFSESNVVGGVTNDCYK